MTYQDLVEIGRDVGRGGDYVGCNDFLENAQKEEILRGCRELPLAAK